MNRQNKTNSNNTHAEKEKNSANSGKIEQVPFSAVKAYLDKYKGIGHLDEKVGGKHGGKMDKEKPTITKNKPLLIKDDSKLAGNCWDNYTQMGMKMKNGKEVPNCVPKKRGHGQDDFDTDDTMNLQQDGQGELRGGETFLPLDEADEEDKMERLDQGENNNFDYAARYSNLLARDMTPNHPEFDAVANGGLMKQNVNNVEITAVVRAAHVLSNDRAISLLSARYSQLMSAQELATQQVNDEQPGVFQFDDVLHIQLPFGQL
jgi:hypothetical protein